MLNVNYGFTRELPGVSCADARTRVETALRAEGFGILTEINVKDTLKQKLDLDFREYVILGACNPQLAHGALTADLGIGLLMPCNVVVTQDGSGNAVLSAIDPEALLKIAPDTDEMGRILRDAQERVKRAIENA